MAWAGMGLAMGCQAPQAPTSRPATAKIDCPLRKAGVDPSHLRPFAEIEDYIAFLERPDRATWQKPKAIIEALGLKGDETVADVGAGSGYFSFRLAAALPRGRVRAIDIEPEMIRHVHHRARSEKVQNLEAVLTTPADPRVDAKDDLVFVCDVLHHVHDREAWLAKLHDEMRPGAKLVLVEFKEGELPAGPPASVKIAHAELVRIVEHAGFRLVEERRDLLPYQSFSAFERP